jgi:hypothetical protein
VRCGSSLVAFVSFPSRVVASAAKVCSVRHRLQRRRRIGLVDTLSSVVGRVGAGPWHRSNPALKQHGTCGCRTMYASIHLGPSLAAQVRIALAYTIASASAGYGFFFRPFMVASARTSASRRYYYERASVGIRHAKQVHKQSRDPRLAEMSRTSV